MHGIDLIKAEWSINVFSSCMQPLSLRESYSNVTPVEYAALSEVYDTSTSVGKQDKEGERGEEKHRYHRDYPNTH